MKFNLEDFLELDTKELFAVNGGYYCTGSSGGASPGRPSPSNGQGSTSSTYGASSVAGSGGGSCNGASDGKTVYKNPYYNTDNKNNFENSNVGISVVGGNCGNVVSHDSEDADGADFSSNWTTVFNGDPDKHDAVDPKECGHLGDKVSEKESDSLLSEMYGYTQNDGFSVGFTQRGFGTGNINVYTLYDSEGNSRDHFYDCDHDGVIDYAKPAR